MKDPPTRLSVLNNTSCTNVMETRKNYYFFASFLLFTAGFFPSFLDCSFTFKGGILVGHSFEILQVSDWYECLRECTSNDKCVSYNLDLSKTGDVVCELNDCGFRNHCQLEKNLIKGNGYIFHQLTRVKLEKMCQKKTELIKIPSEGSIKMAVSCTGRIGIYVDEKYLSNEIILCPQNTSLVYLIPLNARVIALEGMDDDRGQPGLIASLGNGVITDDSWKCRDDKWMKDNWMKIHYNDSTWPYAVVHGNNSSPTWPLREVSGIRDSAKWIWTGETEVTRHVYCRKSLRETKNLVTEG